MFDWIRERSRGRKNRRIPSLLGIATCLASMLVVVGPSTSATTPASAQANSPGSIARNVAADERPPSFTAPGPSFDASAAKGKTLWIIDILSSIPLVQTADNATRAALHLVGANATSFDGKGSVSEYARGVNEAIANRADAIALFAIDPNLVAGPLKRALAAHIPVIVVQYSDPGTPMPLALQAQTTYCYSCAGRMMANWIIANSPSQHVDTQLIVSTEVYNSKAEVTGFTDTMKRSCHSCKVGINDVPVANWQTQIPTLTRSLLTSDPGVNYIVPIYDGMALFAIPAITAMGKSSSVHVVSFNGTLGDMQDLKGRRAVAAEVGSPQAWEGWALADQFLRLMSGQKPLVDEHVGLRTFDSHNINSINLNTPESAWYGVDFAGVYKTMWHVR